MGFINDPYYVGYNMMLMSLKDDNIDDGIIKSLDLAKKYMNAKDILLYKLDSNEYNCANNQSLNNNNLDFLTDILNKASKFLDKKDYLQLNISSLELSNLTFLPISFDDFKYVITITNNKLDDNKTKEFMGILKESFSVALKKIELYRNLKKASTEDGLTGLGNRNSYNEKIMEINNNNDNYVFAIFDLFRLKYINDNFSHSIGDAYIIKSAEILKRYFPKYKLGVSNLESSRSEAGSYIYRIGGDEFVVISNLESFQEIEAKARLATEEVKMIDLGVGEDLILGLNYGIVERKDLECADDLYINADRFLSENKKAMYKKLGINRRR